MDPRGSVRTVILLKTHKLTSKGRLEVYDYIQSLLPAEEVLLSDRKVIGPLELDIYVPGEKFGLEYDGLYWHSEAVQTDRGWHWGKAWACWNSGIHLLAIYQDEWEQKPDLIKALIRQRLGLNGGLRLHVRKLEFRRLEKNKDFRDFFENYHLDGHTPAAFAHGLFYGQKLVACASFRNNFAGELELARLATDYRYLVRGAAGRLLKPVTTPLVSYSNNRVGSGAVYQQLGFGLVREQRPGYWYTDGMLRVGRWKCRRVNDPAVLALHPTEAAQNLAGVQSQKIFGDDRPLYRLNDYGHRKWLRPGVAGVLGEDMGIDSRSTNAL